MKREPTEKGRNRNKGFPDEFLTPNGHKFAQKKLFLLSEEQKQLNIHKHPAGDSNKEASDTERSHNAGSTVVQKQINCWQKILKLPIVPVKEQAEYLLPGNGAEILLNDALYYIVIDGTCLCNHSLPKDHKIVGASSPFGKALLGKKVGKSGTFVNGTKIESKFTIKRIFLPSKVKKIFKGESISV
jgi:hypothetical protein